MHYSWEVRLAGADWAFDRRAHKGFLATACPGNSSGPGLLPRPPDPAALRSQAQPLQTLKDNADSETHHRVYVGFVHAVCADLTKRLLSPQALLTWSPAGRGGELFCTPSFSSHEPGPAAHWHATPALNIGTSPACCHGATLNSCVAQVGVNATPMP